MVQLGSQRGASGGGKDGHAVTALTSVDPGEERMLDVKKVARILGCSPRHVFRLAAAGKMLAPIKLGALVRWREKDLESWLDAGCKPLNIGVEGDRR